MSAVTEQTSSANTTPREVKPVRLIDPALAEVRRQLLASPIAALKAIQAEFYDGVIVLRGRVPTFYTRQVAIALVMKIDGVQQLDDRLTVDRPPLVSHY